MPQEGLREIFFEQIWYGKVIILRWGFSSSRFYQQLVMLPCNNNEKPPYAHRDILSVISPLFGTILEYKSHETTLI